MERASRPAVGVRRVSERRVVQRVRCDIERRRRPGRIGGRARIIPGAAPDLFRRRGGLLPRMPVQQISFRSGEPGRSGAPLRLALPTPAVT
jgi:hypothetical protein